MKKNLEEMQVKVANKRAILESHDGEEFSPITVAKNVLCEDGTTMQDYFDNHSEPNISTKIVNSNSMSKVGQGDNVDFSDNVMNGAYESMVLKGKSMVNCIQEPSNKDVVLPYEFEDGQSVTINDTKESGALGVELKGQTLVNLVPKKIIDHIASSDWDGYCCLVQNSKQSIDQWRTLQDLKPNTKYYISCYVETFEDVNNKDYCLNNPSTESIFEDSMTVNGVGRYQWLSTTKSELTDEIFIVLRSQNALARGAIKIRDIMIIEYQEGMENLDIPYFEGMASCKVPILNSVNQMFDYSLATKPSGSGTVSFTNNGRSLKANFEVTRDCVNVTNITLPAGTYEISYEVRGAVTLPDGASLSSSRAGLSMFKSSQNWYNDAALHVSFANINPTNYTKAKKTITFDESVTVAVVYHGWSNNPVGWCEIRDIRIVPRGKSSILSLPEEVVLRSLPNGVCDTFNTRTGVYTQRIGEAVVNGSENWQLNNTEGTTTQRFFCNMLANSAVDNNTKGTQQYLCDKLRTITWSQTCELGVTINGSGVFVYNNSIEYTVSSVKQWLSQNPVKLQYELATPVVTKINLPSTLKSWNTTTHIYSEIPENTLYPILSHSNPTYPVIIKPSTKYSIVANSYSNDHTNSAINFNLGGATASTVVGNHVTTITTPSTLSNELLTMSGRGNKLNNVMVIEGDVVGDEPYFEGLCDAKTPILLNIGKNLFNINNHTENQWSFSNGYQYEQDTSYEDRLKILGDEIHFSTDGGTVNKGVGYYIPLCKNKDYTFRINKKDGNGKYCVKLFLIHSSEHPLKKSIQQHSRFGIDNATIVSSLEANFNSANYDMCAIYIGGGWESGTHATRSYVFNNISLTESSQQVESYKSNTVTFDQKDDKTIVLRSLPNGVCDTLNVRTGEYVQNIGEIICDGSEDERWAYNIGGSGQGKKCFNLPSELTPHRKRYGYIICDCMPTTNTLDKIGVYNGEGLNILIDSDSNDVGVLKEILANKPITVQYELATPIVKQINVEGYPYAYENGHVLLESGSQEQSLTPTIEYSIVANRGGQIRSNQRMVERHQKKLDSLYAMTLVNMIDSQYKQALMELKSDLPKSEVRTWDIE